MKRDARTKKSEATPSSDEMMSSAYASELIP